MPRSDAFLEAVINFYSNLGMRTVEQMRSTQEELRTGTFKLEKTLGNAILTWSEAAEGWFSALLGTASLPLPTIFLRVGPKSSTVGREIHVRVPGREPPEHTDLVQIGGGKKIDNQLIGLEAPGTRDRLLVKLKGLTGKSLDPGLYTMVVFIRDEPLAIVIVHVDPASGEGGPEPPKTYTDEFFSDQS
jgi:hypothetical protein